MSKMSQEELCFAVLHAQAKAIKRGSVSVNAVGERVYKLSKQDVRLLKETGVSIFEAGGLTFMLVEDTIVELKSKRTKPALQPQDLDIPEYESRTLDYVPREGEAETWNSLVVAFRVDLVKSLGLEGRDGSKMWDELPDKTKAIIRGASKEFSKAEKTSKKSKVAVNAVRPKRVEPEPIVDLLMWVGTKHYPTVDSFTREARKVGCSKRIGKILHIVEPGKTRIFLAHDEGLVGEGFIFGYFVVARLEIIVKNLDDLPERFTDHLTPVELADARKEPMRGCGWRDIVGALYFVSETDPATLKKIAKAMGTKYADIKGGFVELKPLRKYDAFIPGKCRHFRGALRITNGDDIVNAQDEALMTLSPSQRVQKPVREPEWTGKDNKALLKAVKTRQGSKQRALTEFAILNGRSRAKVIYHYNKLMEAKND